MILSIFLIAHLLADFFFQSSTMALKKKTELKHLLFHAFLYFLIFLFAHVLVIDISYVFLPLFSISLLHLVIDFLKEKIERRYLEKTKNGNISFFSFLADQALHFLSILFVFYFFHLEQHGNTWYSIYRSSKTLHNNILYLLLFLIVLSPTAIFIKKIFLLISKKSSDKSSFSEEQNSENLRIGNLIGQLERIIIVFLLLKNQYEAIGLVLAAKSIARFKQMDDKDFAEKYLVGTLSSLLVALLMTSIVKEYLL